MNECTYLGRICTDLVLNKKAMDDKENYWTRFRLAVARKRVKKEGEKDTDFFNCIAFGSAAKGICTYAKKGGRICVCGENRENNFEKDGVKYYDVLRQSPYDMNIIDNIVEVIVNIYASQKECINISGDMIPLNEVINRLKRINLTHIQYVMECIGKSIKSIRRPNNYLLTALYNAPVTTDLYYAMQVKHDLHNYSDG